MSRDAFPFEEDQTTVLAFIAGELTVQGNIWLSHVAGKLCLNERVIAWYDTAGVLTVKLDGPYVQTAVRAINWMARRIGIEDCEVRYEYRPDSEGFIQYFAGDKPINLGEPWVLAGAMSVAAYRAALTYGGK